MGAIATQPLDVLKTRLQSSAVSSAYAQVQGTFFTKTFSSLRNMFVNEGMRGAFSGLVPNLIGVIPSRYCIIFILHKSNTSFTLNNAELCILGLTVPQKKFYKN